MSRKLKALLISLPAVVYFGFVGGGSDLYPYTYVFYVVALIAFSMSGLFRVMNGKAMVVVGTIFLAALVSTVGSGVPSAFLYSLGPVAIFLFACYGVSAGSLLNSREYFLGLRAASNTMMAVFLLAGMVGILFFKADSVGRMSLPLVGNPNYTAMLYFGAMLSCFVLARIAKRRTRNVVLTLQAILILAVILLTQTRSVGLALVVVLGFMACNQLGVRRYIRSSAVLVLMASAFGQLLAYFFLSSLPELQGRSSFSLVDESNLRRVTAYYDIFNVFYGDWSYVYTGAGDIDRFWSLFAGSVENAPHNWFAMMWVSNGLLFTGCITGVFIFACLRMRIEALPGFVGLLIVSGIIGRAVLFAPLCVYILSVWIEAELLRGNKMYAYRAVTRKHVSHTSQRLRWEFTD